MNLFLIILAYLIGSIPSSIWIGKLFYKIDVRQHGSGNAGATNTFRILGKKAGIPVLIIDVLKGFISTYWLAQYCTFTPYSEYTTLFQIGCGVFTVVGHIFPVFAKFKGGKGVATTLGMVIGIHPYSAILCLIIFLIIFIMTNYISMSSIFSSLFFPFSIFFLSL